MSEREQRLRERIDTLTDERDAALAALWKARESRNKWRRKAQEALASREMWRARAMDRVRRKTVSR